MVDHPRASPVATADKSDTVTPSAEEDSKCYAPILYKISDTRDSKDAFSELKPDSTDSFRISQKDSIYLWLQTEMPLQELSVHWGDQGDIFQKIDTAYAINSGSGFGATKTNYQPAHQYKYSIEAEFKIRYTICNQTPDTASIVLKVVEDR